MANFSVVPEAEAPKRPRPLSGRMKEYVFRRNIFKEQVATLSADEALEIEPEYGESMRGLLLSIGRMRSRGELPKEIVSYSYGNRIYVGYNIPL